MKKILMGLVALSATTVFGIDLSTANPQNDTTVFNGEQMGKIPLKGSLTSKVAGVKYVIFASTTGTYGPDSEDTLNIPKIIVTQKIASNIVDYQGDQSKIYVKKVVNGKVQDLGGERVTFTIGLDSYYTKLDKVVTLDNEKSYTMTALIERTQFQNILDKAYKGTGMTATVSTWGEFGITGGELQHECTYRTANVVVFRSNIEGELEVTHKPSSSYGNVDTLPVAQAKLFESQLIDGIGITVPLYVTVEQ